VRSACAGNRKTMKRHPSAAALNRIVERNPDLSTWGMMPRYIRRNEGITAEDHDRTRRQLKEQVRGFQLCVRWLSLFRRRQTINFSLGSSYSLKHLVEEWAGEYVSNGSFIAAAIFLNVTYLHRGDSPNIFVAISSKDIDRPFEIRRSPEDDHPESFLPLISDQAQRSIDYGA
jgi:hypothetical protein